MATTWRAARENGSCACCCDIKTTPVCLDGVVYISLQSGGIARQWIASIDQAETGNRDGKVTKAELQAFVGKAPVPETFYRKTFDRGDLNKDGALEGAELDAAFLPPGNAAGADYKAENPADEYILAVRPGGRGDVTSTHLLWKHATKHTDHIVSPLISDGRMLLVKAGGIATCFETEARRAAVGASPHWQRERLLCLARYRRRQNLRGRRRRSCRRAQGWTKAGSAGHQRRRRPPVLATLAIADGRLFVRTRKALLCLGD